MKHAAEVSFDQKACICQHWALATLLNTVHNKLRFGLVLKLITQTMFLAKC